MAQTMQSISPTLIETAKTQYAESSSIGLHQEEPPAEDALSMMYSIADSLNNLCITLEKLYHVTKMTRIKMQIKQTETEKEEGK